MNVRTFLISGQTGFFKKSTGRFRQFLLAALCTVLMTSGCVSKRSEMGVENRWRDPSLAFEKGRTTQTEVMRELGPPSQVIGLQGQTLFYYLREQSKMQAQFYMVYNETRQEILYDRAIFFFNQAGVLTDFSYSRESIPFKK